MKIYSCMEKADLCSRLIEGGYRTIFFPKVHIFHHFAKGSHKSWRLTKIQSLPYIILINGDGFLMKNVKKLINKFWINYKNSCVFLNAFGKMKSKR